MRSLVSSSDYVDLRVEELSRLEGSFDVIVCLWNVIGHVFPHAARVEAMRQFHRLLRPGGRVFVDVAHRYNAARYGAVRTAGRWLYDHVAPSDTHGDVTASWNLAGREYNVRGHVFTHREFAGMASAAGLVIARRIVVDYDSGAECSFGFQGNLVYIMERPS